MGVPTRGGTGSTRIESITRSTILPQLRSDLVRFDETGGCSNENTI